MTHPDSEGKRGKWIAKIMEYDVDIRPNKLVKGKGLAKLLAESNCQALGLYVMVEELSQKEDQAMLEKEKIMDYYSASTWYTDIVYFLLYLQCREHLDRKDARYLKLRTTKYCLVEEQLFWKYPANILLRCLDKSEIEGLISESHEGACGGRKYWKTTAYKILRARYYWPSLFADVYQQVRACIPCQKFVGKQKLLSLPLKPIAVSAPFQQWGLDFIGEINPSSSGQHRWILTATDFFTKWCNVPSFDPICMMYIL